LQSIIICAVHNNVAGRNCQPNRGKKAKSNILISKLMLTVF
jgi:hypothetical protein